MGVGSIWCAWNAETQRWEGRLTSPVRLGLLLTEATELMELREEADGLRFMLAGVVAITRLTAAALALAGVVEGKPILVTLWTGANRPYLGWHWKYLEGTTIKDSNKKRLNEKKEKLTTKRLSWLLWLACCEFYQLAGVVHPACSIHWLCRLINNFSNVQRHTRKQQCDTQRRNHLSVAKILCKEEVISTIW